MRRNDDALKSGSQKRVEYLFDKNDLQIIQLFGELLSRKRKSICIAFLLFFTVYMVFLSVVLFSVYKLSVSSHHFPWGNFADFRPTQHLIQVHLLDGTDLAIQWGIDDQRQNDIPSYCTEAQWCYSWNGHSQLRINYTWLNDYVDCISINWMGISDLERVKFVNCLHVDNSSGYWFGGIIRTDENWPIRFRHIPYHMGLTGSARWHGDSVIGIFEPSWFSSHSAAISISRKIPFYTNQTTNKLCFKSDKTANYLMYKVCRARDVVDIIRSREQYLQTTSSADDIEKEFPTIGSVIIDIDIDSQGNLSHNLMKVCQTMRNLRLPIKAMYLIKEVDLFQKLDMNAISRTIAACRTNHTFFAAEFGCYVRIRDVENEFIDVTMLVSQHNGSSIGAVQVRNETCFVLDFTKWKVRCWYADQVCKNPLYALVDYVAFYGGSASSLPVESTLNVTLGNLNLYSTAYVDVAWSIAKGLIVDVAYGTQTVPLFINIPTTLEHERNVIAMLLAASLQGYNMFVIQLDSNIPEYASMDEQQRNRLRSWLQLAMVMPMLRVPASIIHNPIFYENLNYYKPIRDKYVLPHYHKAYLQNRLFGDPVMRPIWWFAKDRSSLLTYNHQFMIGNDLIVAAFLHSNEVNYRLYLPPGKWINPDTNVTNDGGTVITVHIGMKYNVVCFIRAEKLTDKPF